VSGSTHADDIRAALRGGEEIALFDVREEAVFAEAHPLFAASLPLGRIELEILDRVPRLTTRVVVYDEGERLVERAVARLETLGYEHVTGLEGGLDGWRRAGGELFRDVNVPSKAFGELVESQRHTPSISAADLKARIDAGDDLVLLDARRFDEYRTMSVPTGVSVPGAELVYRAGAVAPRPETLIVVNCAGRTRSIIGAQSLVNAGIPNQVMALRNGTIGWKLAGQILEHGQTRRAPDVDAAQRARAQTAARDVAVRAGVGGVKWTELDRLLMDLRKTTYCFDVRPPEEFVSGHPRGFRSAPGGQLVQETDVFAPVRGARIVLWDDAGARADMTASWLAQMGWDVFVLREAIDAARLESGPDRPAVAAAPVVPGVTPEGLSALLAAGEVAVVDVAPSVEYLRGHVPGAWLATRTWLDRAVSALPAVSELVVTSTDGVLAAFAAAELAALAHRSVRMLEGGTAAWSAAGQPIESGPAHLTGPIGDRYKRPYEGTDNASEAMQAYLEWEYGLVAQLERDGTHGFRVI
jgi:rhodanese-related sulfurtransferase